jgi:molybdate/tungstate transport system substrate-binding protein
VTAGRSAALSAAALLLAGCRGVGGSGDAVEVLYAGSLTAVMERDIGPAYREATGRAVHGEGRGSVAAAHQIREGVRRPDVYITADTATLRALGAFDPGWAILFAAGELAVGYSERSRYAAALDSAAAGLVPWFEIVTRPGFRFGRTDPELDPKGYRTLWMFELAESHYGRPGLAERLRAASPADGIYPEEGMAARVEAGALDAGAFYRPEALAHGLSVVRLPPEVNQAEPALAGLYARHGYEDRDGRVFRGAPILYAATIPTHARDPDGAAAFIAFLVNGQGRSILADRGFTSVARTAGEVAAVPDRVLRAVSAAAGRG